MAFYPTPDQTPGSNIYGGDILMDPGTGMGIGGYSGGASTMPMPIQGPAWQTGPGTGVANYGLGFTGTNGPNYGQFYGYNGQPMQGQGFQAGQSNDPVSAMMAQNPGMQPWIAQTYVQNGIQPGGQGSGASDWQYWQNQGMQNANGDTGYLQGRIVQAQHGTTPQGGGMGSFGGGPSYNGPPLAMPGGLNVGSLATPGAFQAPEGPLSAAQNINPGQFNYQGLQTPGNFQLPTGQQALDQDPGYQFRLQQGMDALQNSAASRGALRDPNTDRAIVDYGQGAASQEYQNAYNRALQTYQTNTGTNLQAQNQQYQQGLGAYQANAQTGLAANNQNFQNQLSQYQANFQNPLAAYQATNQAQQGAFNANANANIGAYQAQNQAQLGAYNANVNAQLGFGNLGLGFGNLGLQSQLGLGNLGVSQGYLGLAGNEQAFSQPYRVAQLAQNGQIAGANNQLGYYQAYANASGNNSNAMSNLYTGQANANAAGQVASGNAWAQGIGGLGNIGAFYAGTRYPQQAPPAATQPPPSFGYS